MRRSIRVAMTFLFVLALPATPAAAEGPPIPYELHLVLDTCGFDVRFDMSAAAVTHERIDRDGISHSVTTSPKHTFATLTTVASGTSLTLPNDGMIAFTLAPNGDWHFSLRGPQVWAASPLDDDEPGLWWTTGRVDHFGTHFGEEGFTVHYGGVSGQMIDLCPALAP